MKYLILIYGNPAYREVWQGLPDEVRAAGIEQYKALNEELDASGERIASESLYEPARTRRVGATAPMTTDGPFAEVKEHPGRLLPRRVRERGARGRDRGADPGGGAGWSRCVRCAAWIGEATVLLRELAPQVLGALVRRYGDFDTCEDAVQEALLAAAQQWPADGVPANPKGG